VLLSSQNPGTPAASGFGAISKSFPGASRIALLERIDRRGSITSAAKDVGMMAWDAVDAMHNLAAQPLLIRATGGQHGGGSYLTEQGRALVRLYRLLEFGFDRLLAVLPQMPEHAHDFQRLTELIKALTMKISARNQFRGTVKTVRKGAVNADVILDLGEGLEIFANITNEAVEDLGLKPGRDAVALIKSSFIVLSPDSNLRISARNQLRGTITEVIPGSVNGKVKMQLSGGRVLTAIVTNESLKELDLVEGVVCSALIKSSHILIAVND